MNSARLLVLARHLERLAKVKPVDRERIFDLSTWYSESENACGTQACAVGEACCCIPEFQDQGLHIYVDMPAFSFSKGWPAVELFFDISRGEALHLFSKLEYRFQGNTTPKTVADRIRKFVKAA